MACSPRTVGLPIVPFGRTITIAGVALAPYGISHLTINLKKYILQMMLIRFWPICPKRPAANDREHEIGRHLLLQSADMRQETVAGPAVGIDEYKNRRLARAKK
jgi:hypothetical protein